MTVGMFVLQSCQKSETKENWSTENTNITTRIPPNSNYVSTMPVYCTITRDCTTPDPWGGCCLRFPPQHTIPTFPESHAKGMAFVNESNSITLHMYSNQNITTGNQNGAQQFLINDMTIPVEVTESLLGSTSPGEKRLAALVNSEILRRFRI